MVVVSSNTWKEIGHFLRTAVYKLTLARRQSKTAIITGLRSKRDENSHFTGWDQCYSKTNKWSFRNIILRLQRSCLCNKGKVQPRNIGIDGSASFKKIAEKRTKNNKTYEFNEKLREYITQENTEEIKPLPVCNMLSQMATLFYDDINFNFQQGIPFNKNAVLSHFLLTSCNLIRLQFLQYSQSACVSRANDYIPWRQTHRYTNGF